MANQRRRQGPPQGTPSVTDSAPVAEGGGHPAVAADAELEESAVEETAEPLVEPRTDVLVDLTGDDPVADVQPDEDRHALAAELLASAPELDADDDELDDELVVEPPAVVDPDPAPAVTAEPDSESGVRFVCDRWAGVSIHGQNIKFDNHIFVTSDPRKIAVLDAWEHARREDR